MSDFPEQETVAAADEPGGAVVGALAKALDKKMTMRRANRLVDKLLQMAEEGNIAAQRLLLERYGPPVVGNAPTAQTYVKVVVVPEGTELP